MSSTSGQPAPIHVPVLLRETLQHLALEPGLTVVDGTVGAGGHSREILKRIGPTGTLIGLDRDPLMLKHAAARVSGANVHLVQSSYADLPDVLAQLALPAVDRILLDLGYSSDQLADDSRGFSFQAVGPLDLRFDVRKGEPVRNWLLRASADELADVLRKYGEEPFADRIAEALVQQRESIITAADLARAVEAALPAHIQKSARREPATRVFQALRIQANDELGQLERALSNVLYDALRPGGLVVVISFHSLEDRLVKQAFRDSERWQICNHKPVTATSTEQKVNPRSRTAKLRAAKKTGP